MTHLIKSVLLACSLALAASGTLAAASTAADSKKSVKAKLKTKGAKVVPAAEVFLDEPEPDVANDTTTDYNCELGNKVTIYHNDNDAEHIALRWKKRLHRLTRIGTTTGAKRFENTTFGLTWIGIPSKGMLLDSKLNRQLANECKNTEQEKPMLAPAAAATSMIGTPVGLPPAAPSINTNPTVPTPTSNTTTIR